MGYPQVNAGGGSYEIKGSDIGAILMRDAESWQFFAFMFAAIVTLAFALIDEIKSLEYHLALKALSFFALGYLFLWNRRCRNWQVKLLGKWKEEPY